MNKVLSALVAAGLVESRRGAGSFVSRPRVQSAVLTIPDLQAEIEQRGETYHYQLLRRELRTVAAEDARRLGLPGAAGILALKCRHFSGRLPFALEDRILNVESVPQALNQDFSIMPPNKWLIQEVPWSEAEHRIVAREASDHVAAELAIEVGTACLILERRTWWRSEPITAVQFTFPGYLYDMSARFTPTL